MRKTFAVIAAIALGISIGAGVDHVKSAVAAQAYQGANVTTASGILPANHGGTGVANNVAATLTRSGSHALTLTTSGTTSVILPTSGTLYAISGALGTPSSATLTNATGLPIATGISGLGAGAATFLATPTSANLATAVTNETGSGALVFATSPTLVTPVIGAASGTSLIASSSIVISGANTGSIGYTTGAGGAFTQLTSKSTAVTADRMTGNITMNNAALAAAAIVSFTVAVGNVGSLDMCVAQHHSGGTLGAYTINCRVSASGSLEINVRNNTAGSLSEAIVLKYAVISSATS